MSKRKTKTENMNFSEAWAYYAERVEQGEPSDDDNFINKYVKVIYHLGDGDPKKGVEILNERERERHRKELENDPVRAFFEKLHESKDPVERMIVRFLLEDGLHLSMEEGRKLQMKLLGEEKAKPAERVSKRGRKTLPEAQKLEAIKKWDALDRSIHGITLREFLVSEFGAHATGDPIVAVQTFHGWRRDLKIRGRKL